MTLELTIAYAVVPLEELIELIIDHRGKTPKKLGGDFTDYGVPAISAIHIKNGQIQWDERERYVSDAMFQKWMPIKLQKDDVLLTSEAPLGETALVPSDEDLVLSQRLFAIRCNKDSLDPTYFKYFLTSSMGQRVLSARASGSTVIGIRQAELLQIEVPHPDIKIQRTIGKILLSLDAKLQANKQLSKTLEDIAQTIFQSWFIDFDPVKGKMSGEKPVGMDTATAALFPDSMEDSELGLIPKGWEVKSLDDVADYLNGLAMQKFPVTDETNVLPVIKISQLRSGNTFGADIASGLLDSRYIIEDGDILFSWSGTLEVEIWCGGSGALNQHLFKVTGRTLPNWFAYYATKHFLDEFRQIASGKATTMGHIQRGHLTGAKLAIPSAGLTDRMTSIIEPLVALKISMMKQGQNLSEIRDALLPRLISGELQIPEEMLVS
jgi:type I restriction enzyme S subunit